MPLPILPKPMNPTVSMSSLLSITAPGYSLCCVGASIALMAYVSQGVCYNTGRGYTRIKTGCLAQAVVVMRQQRREGGYAHTESTPPHGLWGVGACGLPTLDESRR